MPLSFGADIVEGKVYRSRKKADNEEEKQALRELQTILSYKNRRHCDCEAQVHDLVENCLNCGRLTCVLEGPGKCLSCGGIILTEDQRSRLQKHIDILHCSPPTSSNASRGPRTKIIDNQFDQFTIDNKKHLREEDRRKLREDLEDLQSKRHQRKYVLDVDIDNLEAGLRSMPRLDYEDELKKFQMTHHDIGTSSYTLAELMAKESKIDYNLPYVPSSRRKQPSISEQTTTKPVARNHQRPHLGPIPQALPKSVPISTSRVDKRRSRANATIWDSKNKNNSSSNSHSQNKPKSAGGGSHNRGSRGRGNKRS